MSHKVMILGHTYLSLYFKQLVFATLTLGCGIKKIQREATTQSVQGKINFKIERKPERSVREHVEYQQRRYANRADLE